MLRELEYLDVGLVSDVWTREERDRSSVSVVLCELVEVELPMLEPEVTERPRRHESAFDVAGCLASAMHDVLFFREQFLESILLVVFISAESLADIYGFKLVAILSQ